MQAILLILLIAFLWGVADLIRKLTIGSNFQIVSLAFNFGTIFAPLAIIIYTLTKKNPFKYSFPHLGIAFLGGTLAGLGGLLLFYALFKGAGISTTIPIIRILSIILVAIGGVLLFGEPVTFKFVSGLVLALSGVYLLLS
jgi:drug/metabolite transporter (DMT)-like permease